MLMMVTGRDNLMVVGEVLVEVGRFMWVDEDIGEAYQVRVIHHCSRAHHVTTTSALPTGPHSTYRAMPTHCFPTLKDGGSPAKGYQMHEFLSAPKEQGQATTTP